MEQLINAVGGTYKGNLTLTANGLNNIVYGPASGTRTINGNVTISGNASGDIDLRNLTITGDLTVNTPNATVNNSATVNGTIDIQDVKEGTWNELADGNNLIVNDKNGVRIVIASGVNVNSLALNEEATLVVNSDATFSTPIEVRKLATIISSEDVQVAVDNGVKVTVKQDADDVGTEIIGTGEAVNLQEEAEAAALKSLNDLVAVSNDEGYIQFKTLLETHAAVLGLQVEAGSAYDALKDEEGVRVGAQLAVAKDVLANMPVGGFSNVEDVKIAFDKAVDFRTWTANYVSSAKATPTEEKLFTMAIAELRELDQDFKIQGDKVADRPAISEVVSGLETLETTVSASAETREISVDEFLETALADFEGISFGQVLAVIHAENIAVAAEKTAKAELVTFLATAKGYEYVPTATDFKAINSLEVNGSTVTLDLTGDVATINGYLEALKKTEKGKDTTFELAAQSYALNTLARYAGALKRAEGSPIVAIEYQEVRYTWNVDGTLKGSNWEDAENKTLISTIASSPSAPLILTLIDKNGVAIDTEFKVIFPVIEETPEV